MLNLTQKIEITATDNNGHILESGDHVIYSTKSGGGRAGTFKRIEKGMVIFGSVMPHKEGYVRKIRPATITCIFKVEPVKLFKILKEAIETREFRLRNDSPPV
jgi:hypothetical protein